MLKINKMKKSTVRLLNVLVAKNEGTQSNNTEDDI